MPSPAPESQDIIIPGPASGNQDAPQQRTYQEGDVIAPGETYVGEQPLVIVGSPQIGPTEGIIGGSLLLVLCIVLFFIKRGIENNLIANQARPRKAYFSSWTFFLMGLCISATAVLSFSFTPQLWHYPEVFWSMVAIDIVLALVFLVSFVKARHSARIA